MIRFVWLETGGTLAVAPALIVCHSLANACHLGNDGDGIYLNDAVANRPAAFPAYRIRLSRNGKKRAVRLHY